MTVTDRNVTPGTSQRLARAWPKSGPSARNITHARAQIELERASDSAGLDLGRSSFPSGDEGAADSRKNSQANAAVSTMPA